jgi:hypothetical protein
LDEFSHPVNNLATLLTDVVNGLRADARLAGARVYPHGGEFTYAELKQYAVQAPCVVVSALRTEVEYQDGAPAASVTFGLVCVAKDETTARRVGGVLVLVDAVQRALIYSVTDAVTVDGISAPQHMVGRNLYTTQLDREGIAMWALGWVYTVDLQDDITDLGAFETLHATWDIYPRDNDADLGDVPEAEDDLEIPQ